MNPAFRLAQPPTLLVVSGCAQQDGMVLTEFVLDLGWEDEQIDEE
jgi:hypothetical protein